MAIEIERRWLIDKHKEYVLAQPAPQQLIKQGYILDAAGLHLRIRLVDCKTYLCLKYIGCIVRDEYEYEIPLKDGLEMLERCNLKVEKIRKTLTTLHDKPPHMYDLYPNGLMTVELEFESKEEAEAFIAPSFFGKEITGDKNYSNLTLAQQSLHF
jgi:adenylate cyclase